MVLIYLRFTISHTEKTATGMDGSALGSHALGPTMPGVADSAPMGPSFRELPGELQELSDLKCGFSLVRMEYLFARLRAYTLENHLACLQESNNKATCAGKGEVRLSHWPASTTPEEPHSHTPSSVPRSRAAYAPRVMQLC